MCSDRPSTPREWRVRAEPIVAPDTLTCGNCRLGDQQLTLPPPTLNGDGSFQHSCPCGEVHRLTSKRLARECDELRGIFATLSEEKESERSPREAVTGVCPKCGEVLVEAWGCRVCGWHPNEPEISPGEIRQIAYEIGEGSAGPSDVRRLLKAFCESVERGKAPPAEIIKHLSTAFRAYLGGGTRELEAALGLKRPKGQPKGDPAAQLDRAMKVLHLRLAGRSHQDALAEISEASRSGITGIGKAWAAHGLDALHALVCVSRNPLTSDELAQLKKIYKRSSLKNRSEALSSF
jgi:hypothetical protein